MPDIVKLTYTMTGVDIVNVKELVQAMDIIKVHLTLKETDELKDKILKDIERKENLNTHQILLNIEEQLDKTYKPESN
jgi:SpoU rRNA methylase family enzyme